MRNRVRPAADQDDDRAERIFFQALQRMGDEREAFLTAECGPDARLRAEVDGLLGDHEKAGSFLTADAAPPAELEAEFARFQPEGVGDRISHYRLLEQIGEGGFGTVWVAEQEEPVRRRVALKIIKPGMDSREVIARFEQERQALAMMDHPNIAKVLDAGTTPFGRPFFVMELVRGTRITEFCDQATLPTHERLRLFIAVCHAVQHAHQKGIIHRDLKPSNILVTLHDGVPVPKVIDFGVAKATEPHRLTDLTIYTQFEQMVGTPLYMSPEQAERSGLDIDTRSDIYSLGVLLYELLVGRTPFDPETLMKRGLDEIRRAVREQEPQKPSTFVSTMAVDLRTHLAHHRQTDGAKLLGQIRGDLDWIVMKALEKDRTRRYETATGLAQDIQRHLVSEPVQARPPTQLYRFRRMVRRNKIAFAAASAVLTALVIGLGVSSWMFFKEKAARQRAGAAEHAQAEERKRAETEADKSQQIAHFLVDMLEGVGPSVARGRDTELLREILDQTAQSVGEELKDQPEVEADLRHIIGNVHLALGDYAKAAETHAQVLALRRQRFGPEHPLVAASLNNLAGDLADQGKLIEAEALYREALAIEGRLAGHKPSDSALTLHNLACVLVDQGRLTEGESMHREALALERTLRGSDDPAIATSLNNFALALQSQGKLAEAEAMQREALAMRRKVLGNDHPDVASSLNNLGIVLLQQGKLPEAEATQREALAMKRKLLHNDHPEVATAMLNLAHSLRGQRKLDEADSLYREALAMHRKFLGNDHRAVAASLNGLGTLLHSRGKDSEAEPLLRESVAMARKLLGDEHPDLAQAIDNLGVIMRGQQKYAEAETLHRQALAMSRKALGNEHPQTATARKNLAKVLEIQGKPAEAE